MHAEDIRRFLAEAIGRPVRLKMNSNLHTMISYRRDGAGPGICISLNRIFLEADQHVIDALPKFVTRPTPDVRATIRTFINTHSHHITEVRAQHPPATSSLRGTARGNNFNLQSRAETLNEIYFQNAMQFRIIWGRGREGARRQRHITLGTWNDRQKVIRIHPILDNATIPLYFLDFVIYHEMLHIAVPSRVSMVGKAIHHGAEFRRRERNFAQYREAILWEKTWIDTLLACWSRAKPLPANACNK